MRFLDGSLPCPPCFLPDCASWEQQDAAIISTLLSSLSENILPRTLGKNTSKLLWDSLKKTYAKASVARTMELHNRLINLKQGDMSISDYFGVAMLIKDELVAIGKEPTYEDFKCQVFHNLHSDFEGMINNINGRNDEPDMEKIQDLLLSVESMQKQKVENTLASPELAPDPPHIFCIGQFFESYPVRRFG